MAEVASAYITLIPQLQGGAEGIRKAIGGPVRKAGEDGGQEYSRGMRGALAGAASKIFAPIAAAAGAAAVGTFFKNSINQASDLAEAGTALGEVFGDSVGTVQEFAAGGAKALGQNSLEVQRAAQTFGVYGKAAGLASGANAEFSTDLVGLSTDLASFYNTDPSQAVEALASGLRGEAEPLRQFGILLDDATLKSKAMELGIYEGTGSLTQQQKILASQAAIMEQAGVASGDFERTSGGLANQQRILAATFTDFQGEVGAAFLPAVTAAITKLNELAGPTLNWVSGAIVATGDLLSGQFTPAVREAFGLEESSAAVGAFSRISDAAKGTVDVIRGDFTPEVANAFNLEEDAPVLQTIDSVKASLLSTGQSAGAAFLAPLAGAFSGLVAALGPLLPQLVQAVGLFSPLGLIFKALMPVLPQLAGLVGGVLATAIGALGPILTQIVPLLAEIAGVLIGALSDAFVALLPAIMSIVEALMPIIDIAAELISALLPPLVDIIKAILPPVAALIATLVGALAPILKTVANLIASVVVPIIRTLADWFGRIVRAIAPIVAAILSGLINALSGLIGWLGRVINAAVSFTTDALRAFGRFASGVGDAIGDAIQWFRDLPGRITGAISGAGQWLVNVGRDIIDGLIRGLTAGFERVKDTLTGLTDLLPDWKGPAERDRTLLYNSGQLVIGGFVSGLESEYANARRSLTGFTSGLSSGVNLTGGVGAGADGGLSATMTDAQIERLALAFERGATRTSTRVLVDADTASRYVGG